MRALKLLTFYFSLLTLLALSGCETQRETESWWKSSGKANAKATLDLIAFEAATIAEKTVYAKAGDATDALAKNFNVQGFGDGLRVLESGLAPAAIGAIPNFVMRLRQVWLPKQEHYTKLAANVAQLIAQKYEELHPQTDTERTAIIEGVIKGLQTPAPALVGP